MMKNAKEKWVEYTLYVILFAALVMCLYFIFISSSLSQRILAGSLIITIIIGGFINMWKIFHSSDKLDDVSNNLTVLSKKLNDLVDLKEKELLQIRDIEEQRRKDVDRPVTEPLKEELEKFLIFWKEKREFIFEKPHKTAIFGSTQVKMKLPWMEIESIGKKLKIVIDDNKNILRTGVENEAIEIADKIIELSKTIRAIENLRFPEEYDAKRKKQVFNEGDKIVKDIGVFIEKI